MSETIVKGYKVFDENWECHGFKYEVGKTYTLDGELQICRSGFHFCKKAASCFNYKDFDTDNKCAEVEALGKIVDDGDKCATDKIRIVRELSWEEMLELCNTGLRNKGIGNSGSDNCGHCNTGDHNCGNLNAGHLNNGNGNTGSWNRGIRNVGNKNVGDWNSGDGNTGYGNSGDFNQGNRNSGHRNCGNRNSGEYNSGNWNSGNWNSGDWNSGYLNTTRPPIRIFDKEVSADVTGIRFPDFFYFKLVEWVDVEDMTEKEKKLYPEDVATGGYQRRLTYKEAWRKSLNTAKKLLDWPLELDRLLALPNFDFKKFEQITGITKEDILGD